MYYGDLAIKKNFFNKDADAIIQKMEMLLSSHKNDWFFNRDFDCDLRFHLFKPYESWSIDKIKFDLEICFNKNLKEVKLLKETDIKYDPDTRTYILNIVFEIKGIEGIHTFDYGFRITQ